MVRSMGRAWAVLMLLVGVSLLSLPQGARADLDDPDSVRRAAVRGLVVDSKGDAVARAQVAIVDARTGRVVANTTTNERGLFGARVPGGHYVVRAAKRGEGTGTERVAVRPGNAARVRVTLEMR